VKEPIMNRAFIASTIAALFLVGACAAEDANNLGNGPNDPNNPADPNSPADPNNPTPTPSPTPARAKRTRTSASLGRTSSPIGSPARSARTAVA